MSCNNITVKSAPEASLKGKTFYVEDQLTDAELKANHKVDHRLNTKGCLPPTAVYISDKRDKSKDLNVILWFHGWHVQDYQQHIFHADTAKGMTMLRESVDAAEMDVVLVVPFLGTREARSDPAFVMPTFDHDGTGIEGYLKHLFEALKDQLGTTNIGRLVLACHSGSGNIMIEASKQLGKLADKMKECWGFDCQYGNDYSTWVDGLSDKFVYFYQGDGSYAGEFKKLWIHAYGSPKRPNPKRLNYVFLAPGLKNPTGDLECLTDAEVFQSFEAIQLKDTKKFPLTPYESFRLNKLDPMLDRYLTWHDPKKDKDISIGWEDIVAARVKNHYVVVQDLVTPRIVGLFDASKPSGANVIAQVQAQCHAGLRKVPPTPKPVPVVAGNRR